MSRNIARLAALRTFDAHEDGVCHECYKVLGRVYEGLGFRDSNLVGCANQVGVAQPIAQPPPSDTFFSGAVPAAPDGTRGLMAAEMGPIQVRQGAPYHGKRGHGRQGQEGKNGEDGGVTTAGLYLSARVGSGRKGARCLASFEEDIGSEDSNQGSLASEERKGQPVTPGGSLRFEGRHGGDDSGQMSARAHCATGCSGVSDVVRKSSRRACCCARNLVMHHSTRRPAHVTAARERSRGWCTRPDTT